MIINYKGSFINRDFNRVDRPEYAPYRHSMHDQNELNDTGQTNYRDGVTLLYNLL